MVTVVGIKGKVTWMERKQMGVLTWRQYCYAKENEKDKKARLVIGREPSRWVHYEFAVVRQPASWHHSSVRSYNFLLASLCIVCSDAQEYLNTSSHRLKTSYVVIWKRNKGSYTECSPHHIMVDSVPYVWYIFTYDTSVIVVVKLSGRGFCDGSSLVQRSPNDCACLSLSVINCTNHHLHLQWTGWEAD